MKKTTFKVISSYSLTGNTLATKRVYVDESGLRYIKTKDGYRCIENTPCLNYIIED